VKNQQRWNFGALCPESYSLAQRGTEAWTMQTECLVEGSERATLDIRVRFLHLLTREVGVPNADCGLRVEGCGDGEIQASVTGSDFNVVPSLEVGGRVFQTWQEAVEREFRAPGFDVETLKAQAQRLSFSFPPSRALETLRDEGGRVVGVIVRTQQSVGGALELSAARAGGGLFKITARILNTTPLEDAESEGRDDALMRSLVSTHTILKVGGGEFVSLLDPPEAFRDAAAGCGNTGTWPVMVGEEGERGVMLSSPIILYDYPQIAPESAGELFDGTEIDEILTLRIMTLTDEEKREMRGAGERARRILERTETLPAEQLMKMHGAMRGVPPRKEEEI